MASHTDPDDGDGTASPDGPSSRAGEVLDALVRDQSIGLGSGRGPGQRFGLGRSAGSSGQGRTRMLGALRPGALHPGALGAALLVVAVVVAVVLWRRPAPIEDRLPIASADAAAADPAATESAAADSAAADPVGAGSGSSSGAPPSSAAGAQPTELVVHVAGAVAAPGVVRLAGGSRVVDAVTAAGGLRPDADPDRVNLAAPLTDGQRVVVPILGQPAPAEVVAPGVPADPEAAAGAGGSPTALVDINTATAAQLEELPGVGPATAAAIVAHREEEGPFRSVDALLDVRGIGDAKLEALRDLVSVGGTS